MIWFKHIYWPEPDRWGVLGLPITQSGNFVLRNYNRGDPVLLALVRKPSSRNSGHICWVCSLLSRPGATSKIINPDIPQFEYENWPEAIAIDELWEVEEPLDYKDVADGKLGEYVRPQQGRFFPIKDGKDELVSWLNNVKLKKMDVVRSKDVQDYLDCLESAREGSYVA